MVKFCVSCEKSLQFQTPLPSPKSLLKFYFFVGFYRKDRGRTPKISIGYISGLTAVRLLSCSGLWFGNVRGEPHLDKWKSLSWPVWLGAWMGTSRASFHQIIASTGNELVLSRTFWLSALVFTGAVPRQVIPWSLHWRANVSSSTAALSVIRNNEVWYVVGTIAVQLNNFQVGFTVFGADPESHHLWTLPADTMHDLETSHCKKGAAEEMRHIAPHIHIADLHNSGRSLLGRFLHVLCVLSSPHRQFQTPTPKIYKICLVWQYS